MSLRFDFIFGEPVDGRVGRWLRGAVVTKGLGYSVMIDLVFRYSAAPGVLQNRISLDVDRPFDAGDFAAILNLLTTANLETTSRELEVRETKDLDLAGVSAIRNAVDRFSALDTQQSLKLPELTSLTQQLEQIRKRERMSLAFARFRMPPPA